MANTVLSPSTILREAGRIFHQEATFLKTIDRHYDDAYKNGGVDGKRGATIKLRDAVEFTVSDGAAMVSQDVTETAQDLTIGTQKHVAFTFSDSELTLNIDDFSQRYLQPAMKRLVATIEGLAIADFVKKIPNLIDGDTKTFSFDYAAEAKQRLDEVLAPTDRTLLLSPKHHKQYMSDTKGLFTPGGALGTQYEKGVVQDALGFNVLSSTHLGGAQATGTAVKVTTYLADLVAGQDGSTIHIDTGATTFKAGDVITFGVVGTATAVYAVHPETKVSYPYLKQFTVTEDYAGGEGDIKIYPSVVASGGKQNVDKKIPDNAEVTKVGAAASETLIQSIAYPKDSFVFATADLVDVTKYGKWGAREVIDGVSMRIWRDAIQSSDTFPTRIDVFCGWLARYPNKAARIHCDG